MERELKLIISHARAIMVTGGVTHKNKCSLIIEIVEHLLSRLDSSPTNDGQGEPPPTVAAPPTFADDPRTKVKLGG